jgi:hypothetical protein
VPPGPPSAPPGPPPGPPGVAAAAGLAATAPPPPTSPVAPPAAPPPARDPNLATGLVAANATTAPAPAPEAPRPVAKTTVAANRGETTVGGTVTPVGGTQPTAVTPMKPTAPTGRPKPTKQPPTRKILPGDLICGDCGEGNPPARNFCSRCGNSLKTAAVAKRHWWQKLIPHRKRKTMEAGARPWKSADGSQKSRKRSGAFGKVYVKLRPIVAILILVAGLVIGFSPNLREKVTGKFNDATDSVESKLKPTFVPLAPVNITVSSELPDQPGANVIDTNPLTFWVAPGSDPQPTIVVTFDQPFNLEKIKLWNGAATGYKDHERASEIHFVFDTGKSYDLHVDDIPDGKEYSIKNGQGVKTVELHVTGTVTSLTSDQLGLSEIEFYFKK